MKLSGKNPINNISNSDKIINELAALNDKNVSNIPKNFTDNNKIGTKLIESNDNDIDDNENDNEDDNNNDKNDDNDVYAEIYKIVDKIHSEYPFSKNDNIPVNNKFGDVILNDNHDGKDVGEYKKVTSVKNGYIKIINEKIDKHLKEKYKTIGTLEINVNNINMIGKIGDLNILLEKYFFNDVKKKITSIMVDKNDGIDKFASIKKIITDLSNVRIKIDKNKIKNQSVSNLSGVDFATFNLFVTFENVIKYFGEKIVFFDPKTDNDEIQNNIKKFYVIIESVLFSLYPDAYDKTFLNQYDAKIDHLIARLPNSVDNSQTLTNTTLDFSLSKKLLIQERFILCNINNLLILFDFSYVQKLLKLHVMILSNIDAKFISKKHVIVDIVYLLSLPLMNSDDYFTKTEKIILLLPKCIYSIKGSVETYLQYSNNIKNKK